jgi:hypothetical protein
MQDKSDAVMRNFPQSLLWREIWVALSLKPIFGFYRPRTCESARVRISEGAIPSDMPKPTPVPDALVAVESGVVKSFITSDGFTVIPGTKGSGKPGNGNKPRR